MQKILTALLLCLVLPLVTVAQKKNEAYTYFIKRTQEKIRIDGVADDSTWSNAQVASGFFQVLPMDTSFAKANTRVRMTYDARFLYILAENFQSHPLRLESLRRDWNFPRNDNFTFFLDPYDDQTNGFAFGVNAAGAEWDGQEFEGSTVNLSWDNRWFSTVRHYPDRWVFEAAIPFKTLRYKKDLSHWGINFSRLDITTTEKSVWAPVPRQLPTASLAYTGVLNWETPPPQTGPNISLIPFVLGGVSRQIRPTGEADTRSAIGLDGKVALSSQLNLDLTVNPDFSQVEVDRQVTNLDRFELFFPERRQFFLENSDLFNNLGFNSIRPFFSRRIGLFTPIHAGARVSGRLNKDWRIGAMNMQTGAGDDGVYPAQNFSVLSVQRRFFTRSNLNGFMVNKENINADQYTGGGSRFNRVAGLEYNLASKNDLWRGKFYYSKSFSPRKNDSTDAFAAVLRYGDRKFNFEINQERIEKKYNPETGFLQRSDHYRTGIYGGYNFFPQKGKLLVVKPGWNHTFFMQKMGNTIENETSVYCNFTFRDQTYFTIWTANNYIELLQTFDPTNLKGIKLPIGSRHIWNSFGTRFESKPQKLLTGSFESRYGGFYANGTRLRLASSAAWRFQPYGSVAVSAEYNDIKFPQNNEYGLINARFWLISPRLDVTFTKKIYLTTFLQYNEQNNNVNLNTRFQWRYAPASDLFIVYTDNYFPDSFLVKNRAFVLKLTYWWNV